MSDPQPHSGVFGPLRRVLLVTEDEALVRALDQPEIRLSRNDDAAGRMRFDAALVDLRNERAEELAESLLKRAVPVIVVADDEGALDRTPRGIAGAVLRPFDDAALALQVRIAARLGASRQHATAHMRRLALAVESTTEAIATADERGVITFLNSAAEALTGWLAREAVGAPLSMIFPIDPATANKPDSKDSSVPLRRRDGSVRLVEHNASPIVDAGGELLGVVLVLRDVTARRALEARLAVSDRLASVGRLAAGIAHEINNPLAFIVSNLDFSVSMVDDVLRENRASDAKEALLDMRAALRDASVGAARAAEIVKDMMKFTDTALDAQAATPVDLNRVCEFAARIAANEVRHRAALSLDLKAERPVRADEGALTQVLVNLLTNAAHSFAPTGKQGSISLRTWSDATSVYAEVKDNGRGIPSADLPRIFEPFFSTKPTSQGSGLDLALCHATVTSAGGTLTCDSVEGQGSTFHLRLPCSLASDEPATRDGAAKPPTVRPKRVLVIDDEELIGAAIRRILTRAGIEVVFEGEGQRAVDRLAGGERFDCILCDLMMPGLSGADVYDAIATHAPSQLPRIVLMTGNAFAPREKELFTSTTNVTVEKPFLPEDLKGAVDEVLRRHGALTGG